MMGFFNVSRAPASKVSPTTTDEPFPVAERQASRASDDAPSLAVRLDGGSDLDPISTTLVKSVFCYQESIMRTLAPVQGPPNQPPSTSERTVRNLLAANRDTQAGGVPVMFHIVLGQVSATIHRGPAFLSDFLSGFSDSLICLWEPLSTSKSTVDKLPGASSAARSSNKAPVVERLASPYSPGHVVVRRRIETVDFAAAPFIRSRHYVWCPDSSISSTSSSSSFGEGKLIFFDDPSTLDHALFGPAGAPLPLRLQEALEEISNFAATNDDFVPTVESNRGSTCGFFEFLAHDHDQTRLALTQKVLLDASQYRRTALKSILRLEFSFVQKLHTLLDRSTEIDDLYDKEFRDILRDPPPLSSDELAVISRSIKTILISPSSIEYAEETDTIPSSKLSAPSFESIDLQEGSDGNSHSRPRIFQRVASSISQLSAGVTTSNPWRRARHRGAGPSGGEIVQKYMRKEKGGNISMRGVITVHEAPETVLSWLWRFCSEERLKVAHMENPGVNLPRINIVQPGRRSAAQCSAVRSVAPFESRIFENFVVWSTLSEANATEPIDLPGGTDGGYSMAFEPLTTGVCLPQSWLKDRRVIKCVRAFTKGIYIIQRVAPKVSKVTLIQQVVLGGFVPLALSTFAMSHMEKGLKRMYGRYQRAGSVIDCELRDDFVQSMAEAIIEADPQALTRTTKNRLEETKQRCRVIKGEWDLAMESLLNDDEKSSHRLSNRISFKMAPLIRSLSQGGGRKFTKTTKMNYKAAPLVDLWMRKSNRNDVSTRAVAVIDTSAETYIAAVFDHCSNRRMALMKSEYCVARTKLELSNLQKNERVVATVLRIPSTNILIETTTRIFWTYEGMEEDDRNGHYLIYVESVDLPTSGDYSANATETATKLKIVGLHVVERLYSQLADSNGLSHQCKVTYLQTISAEEKTKVSDLLVKAAPVTNFFLDALRHEFQQDAKVDAEVREDIKKCMSKRENPQSVLEKSSNETGSKKSLLLHEEDSLSFDRTTKKFLMLKSSAKLRPIDSIYPGVKVHLSFKEGSHSFFARAELTIDAALEDVASFDYMAGGRKRLQRFYASGGVSRRIIRRNMFSCRNLSEINLFIPGLSHRYFDMLTVWRRTDDNTIVVTNEPFADSSGSRMENDLSESDTQGSTPISGSSGISFSPSSSSFTGKSTSKLWTMTTYSKLPKIAGMYDQTRVTFYVTADVGSLIPRLVQSKIAWKRFGFLNSLINEFSKSDLVDRAASRLIYDEIEPRVEGDQAHQEVSLENDPLFDFAQQLMKETRLMSKLNAPRFSPFLSAEMGFDDGVRTRFFVCGTARASVAEVLGFLLNYEAKAFARVSDVSRTVVERHIHLKYQIVKLLEYSADQKTVSQLSTKNSWRKVGGSGGNEGAGYVFIAENAETASGDAVALFNGSHGSRPLIFNGSRWGSHGDRGSDQSSSSRLGKQMSHKLITVKPNSNLRTVINIVASSSETTYVEIFFTVKSKHKNRYQENMEVVMVNDMLESLFRRRRQQELSSVDGASLGVVFGDVIIRSNRWFSRSKKLQLADGIDSVFARYVSLKELDATCEWLKPMLRAFLRVDHEKETKQWFSGWWSNSEKEVKQQRRTVPLRTSCLDANDGDFIGATLWEHIENTANHSLAVEQWILSFPAIKEFSANSPFFEPMMRGIAKVEVTKLTPGKLFDCGKKTFMSVMDLITDVVAVRIFMQYGQNTIATILTIIIVIAMCFQIFCCVLVHHRNFNIMCRELVYVVFCLKSGVNHFRVITKAEPHGHELVDSAVEKAMFTGIDLVVESVPGTVIQIYAFLMFYRNFGWTQYLSTAIGILFAALCTLYLDVPKDRDPHNRASSPLFYGLLPDVGGKLVPVCMFIMFSTQLLMKALLYALLATFGRRYLAIYAGAEWLLFICYKILRQDYTYWLNVSGLVSHVITIFFRIFTKIITDFTCMFQLRHAFELGGACWLASAVSAHVALGVLLSVADLSHLDVSHSLLSNIALSCAVLWWASFAGVLRMCNKDFVGTFFDTRTAAEFSRDSFMKGDDTTKASFVTDKRIILKLYESEIALWLEEGWSTWEVERPPWFTDSWKASLPQDLRPEDSFR